MSLFADLISKNNVDKLPNCEECNINENEQKERDGDRSFLILVRGKLVCGRCAVKLLMPKNCEMCNHQNPGHAKYCLECGGIF